MFRYMKIILLKDVAKIGRKYEVKNVADGFALNMLIPRGMAQVATPQAIKNIETFKSQDMTEKNIQSELLLKNLEVIKDLKIVLKEKANEKGHLFAGVTKEILAEEIKKSTRLNLDPDFIKMAKPIKEVGEHQVTVEAMGKQAHFKVMIEAV